MRKTIAAIALALSAPVALATGQGGGDSASGGSGAFVTSSASVSVSGNGSAYSTTGGYQSTKHGVQGDSGSTNILGVKVGAASVEGVAGAKGGAYSFSATHGNATANSGTFGVSGAGVEGKESYYEDRKFKGSAEVDLHAVNVNKARTESGPGFGAAKMWNLSGTKVEGEAEAGGLQTPGFWIFPGTNTVGTSATVSGHSHNVGGGWAVGNAGGYRYSDTFGGGDASAYAKSGSKTSND